MVGLILGIFFGSVVAVFFSVFIGIGLGPIFGLIALLIVALADLNRHVVNLILIISGGMAVCLFAHFLFFSFVVSFLFGIFGAIVTAVFLATKM